MSVEEQGKELADKIGELGESIKKAKAEKKPKEEWDCFLTEMLALKAKYKEVTGKDFGPPPKQDTKKKQQAAENEGPSDKNKEKRAAKAAAKAEKERKKAEQRAEREKREKEKAEKLAVMSKQDNFGDSPRVQSQAITDKVWTKIENVTPAVAGQEVLLRGHLQTVRGIGKGAFVLVRSSLYSIQGVAFENTTAKKPDDAAVITSDMIKYIAGLPVESVVDMKGIVTVPETPIESATQKNVEIQITAFHCICKSKAPLPFLIEDAMRPDDEKETDIGEYNEEKEVEKQQQAEAKKAAGDDDDVVITVGQKMRLDYRWIDLRTPANQAIMRIESMVGCLFREFLMKENFVELHSPKLIGGASEGGSDVFELNYFNQKAFLAMSPQLHKQISAANSGFERVYETGPVFRAENSNTRRHLCEFTGFDLEMVIYEHYDEILHVFSDLFIYIFDGINARCKPELERVREQHPFEDIKYLNPTLKLTYKEGVELLREAGVQQGEYDDLSTENEKKLGNIVKEKYGTDFFFMDKYPLAVRPFYTMPDPENPQLSNSYDFFIRGQEILSGAQRIHDIDLLEERAKHFGIPLDDIKFYLDSFRNGSLPHGGGGIGLERVVMLFLNLSNIRKTAWFPRDPKRISP